MEQQPNRIYFLNNPYPKGHKIIEFIWKGRIDEAENQWFDFHLKTEDYYAEDDSDDEGEVPSDWDSKIVWGNYHNCILSSTYWPETRGIHIADSSQKLDFDLFIQEELLIDPLPLQKDFDYEDFALHIYLLGHDSCADHRIKIAPHNQKFEITWSGKIALTYAGEDEFKYDFRALIQNVTFDGFHYPTSWSLKKASEIFQRKLVKFEEYEFVDLNPKSNKREYKLSKRRA